MNPRYDYDNDIDDDQSFVRPNRERNVTDDDVASRMGFLGPISYAITDMMYMNSLKKAFLLLFCLLIPLMLIINPIRYDALQPTNQPINRPINQPINQPRKQEDTNFFNPTRYEDVYHPPNDIPSNTPDNPSDNHLQYSTGRGDKVELVDVVTDYHLRDPSRISNVEIIDEQVRYPPHSFDFFDGKRYPVDDGSVPLRERSRDFFDRRRERIRDDLYDDKDRSKHTKENLNDAYYSQDRVRVNNVHRTRDTSYERPRESYYEGNKERTRYSVEEPRDSYNNRERDYDRNENGVRDNFYERPRDSYYEGNKERTRYSVEEPRDYNRERDYDRGVRDRVREKYYEDKEKVKQFAEETKDKAKESIHNAKDYIHDKKENVKDYVEDKKETVEDFVFEKKKRAKEIYNKEKEKVKQFAEETKDKAKESINNAKDFIHDKKERVKDFVEDKKEKVEDFFHDKKEKTKEMYQHGKEKVKNYIDEKKDNFLHKNNPEDGYDVPKDTFMGEYDPNYFNKKPAGDEGSIGIKKVEMIVEEEIDVPNVGSRSHKDTFPSNEKFVFNVNLPNTKNDIKMKERVNSMNNAYDKGIDKTSASIVYKEPLTSPTYSRFPLKNYFANIFSFAFGRKEIMNYPINALSDNMDPGNCYSFEGQKGNLTIDLKHPSIVRAVSIDHPHTTHQRSSPKKFSVFSFNAQSLDQLYLYSGSGVVIGKDFLFDHSSVGPKIFETTHRETRFLQFRFQDNHGDKEYTCVYRINVYVDKE